MERDSKNRPKDWHHINGDHSQDTGPNVTPIFRDDHFDAHIVMHDYLSAMRLDNDRMTVGQRSFAGYQRFLCQVFRNTYINRMANPKINKQMIRKRDSLKVPWHCSICKKYGRVMNDFLKIHGVGICNATDVLYPSRNNKLRANFEDYCRRKNTVWDEAGKKMVPRELSHGKSFFVERK